MDYLIFICIIFIVSVIIFLYTQYRAGDGWGGKGLLDSFVTLNKHHKNPLLSPKPYLDWQAGGTFNPAAFTDDNGRVHVVYRAVGSDGVSRLGYASSSDQLHFDDHEVYPVFSMSYDHLSITPKRYDPILYPSGGSFGGCEDPRMVRIDERIYVTFSAFDNWGSIRVGLISIHEYDFFNKRWNWTDPLLISPPGQVHKNWVLFPEKIHGKFAIIHSIVPEVLVEYVDTLNANTKPIESPRPAGPQPGKKGSWDDRIRGAGPPPIKTEKGWLLLYHAMEKGEHHKYKIGAMLLDLRDPSKVIARARQPIMEPDMWYEDDWKPGIVYACGATVKDDTLYVYYGGGDKHICVAHTSLSGLLSSMIN
jgi:predicted GH43/DUF377 family glycosyl hydrolase